ncbi:MAG: type II secretion system F family protein [Kiritimatiellae bacterium]|nr:type II secretion system F family protein [Kiritimatiellia bacterium]
MGSFSATVKDATGVRREILREAESSAEVASQLRTEGYLVLQVTAAKVAGALPSAFHPAWLLPTTSFDVEMGLRQLASMAKSGVSLLMALETVSEQARRPRAARAWRRVRDRVLAGDSFADALAAQPRVFSELVVRLARVGEQSGELDVALLRAGEQLEARRNLRALVVNALVYPALAVTMAIGVSAFLVVTVIPKIANFLQASGAELPQMTQLLVDLSDWLVAHGGVLAGGVAGVLAVWFTVRATEKGRELQDVGLLKVPVVGRILRLSGTAVFSRAMQTLLASGVSLLEALEGTSKLLANRRFRRRIETAQGEVMRGTALATALGAAREFMPMLSRMAAVGEMTGSLAETFGETARYHEMMLAIAVKRFSVLIEPILICITGVIVGFVYIAFFMAIFALAGSA